MRRAAVDGLAELWADGRLDDALRLVDAALRVEGDDGALHAWRALTLVELRRLDEAAIAAARGLALAPDDRLVRLVGGDVALQRGDLATAARLVDAALAADTADPDALVLAARLRAQQGEWRAARAAAQLALSHAPSHEGAAVLVALAVEQRAPTGAATEAWAEVAARFPANALARTRLGWAALRAGDRRAARDTFETALVLDPADDDARDGLVAAIAAAAPWHGLLLGALQRIGALGRASRLALWAVVGSAIMWLATQVAEPAAARTGAALVGSALAGGVLLVWLGTPVLDAAALLAARGRELVRGRRRAQAMAAVGLVTVGALAVGAAIVLPNPPTALRLAGPACVPLAALLAARARRRR